MLDYWHIHPSGTISVTVDGESEDKVSALGPSPSDKGHSGTSGVRNATAIQVDTYGDVQVNFYNTQGTIFL